MNEYRFEVSAVVRFSVRADSEVEARQLAVPHAVGKLGDMKMGPFDAVVVATLPHDIRVLYKMK